VNLSHFLKLAAIFRKDGPLPLGRRMVGEWETVSSGDRARVVHLEYLRNENGRCLPSRTAALRWLEDTGQMPGPEDNLGLILPVI